jgi:hypothetical protein
MALKTFNTILGHFSFVHQPTFRLMDTSACLAFAICTVGGIRTGHHQWDYLLQRVGTFPGGDDKKIDGPVVPGESWESIYQRNYSGERGNESAGDGDAEKVENWESGAVVRSEKTNMLVKVCTFITAFWRD